MKLMILVAPSDEQQFEAMDHFHQLVTVLESQSENPLFLSPVPDKAANVLDVGTGSAAWAIDVADRYPNCTWPLISQVILANIIIVTLYGVDLYPPPQSWVPPNCFLEVDDVTKPWLWEQKFDLIHIRFALGAFTDKEWQRIYREAYKHLAPGGWIEQVETDVMFNCDDGSVPSDSILNAWGPNILQAAAKSGKRLDILDTMEDSIKAAGFVNLKTRTRKSPVGPWAKGLYKSIGQLQLESDLQGMEGYAMYLMTRFGTDRVWDPAEVRVTIAMTRAEMLKPTNHTYHKIRRVWAQKPLEKQSQPEAEA